MPHVPHHELIEGAAGDPGRTAVFLHGLLGSSRHWRPFARRFVEACPVWRAVVVDLRHHGRSRDAGGEPTVAACAEDLLALERVLGNRFAAVSGHSFGAKVAIAFARRAEAALRAVLWVDAGPGPSAEPALARMRSVLARVRELGESPASREAVERAFRGDGHGDAFARFMGTTVERRHDGRLVWRFDPAAVARLLADYAAVDAWPALEDAGRSYHVAVVRAGRDSHIGEDDASRLKRLGRSGSVSFHVLPEAGHLPHVDDPAGLLRIVSEVFAAV